MDPLRRQAGLTLAETVVASFLLLSGFLVVARLFHTSLRYQAWVDSVTLATGVGEEVMESVRSWAQDPNNFNNLEAIYSPMSINQDGMTLLIQAGAAVPMASPSNEMERAFPVAQRRVLRSSYKPLQVTVQWSRDQLQLHTLLGAPPRSLRTVNPLVVSAPDLTPLAQGASIPVAVALYDATGAEIPDVFFSWSVEPINGKGTLENVTRDGLSGQFTHKMMKPDGTFGFSPGISGNPSLCQVSAGATYLGREIIQLSAPLDLAP